MIATSWLESDLAGSTAVVTGAASGIGRSLSLRLARAGMRLVIADIEGGPLQAVGDEVSRLGAPVDCVTADVSLIEDNERVAETARHAGAVSVVCLNAGVALLERDVLSASAGDWEWILGVNLWGAIHGTHAMLPLLREAGRGRIVYSASIASLLPATTPYQVSKWGVHAFATAVAHQLAEEDSPVRAITAYIGPTASDIAHSWRRRPPRWGGAAPVDHAAVAAAARGAASVGVPPDEVADRIVCGMLLGHPGVLTHPFQVERVREQFEVAMASISRGVVR